MRLWNIFESKFIYFNFIVVTFTLILYFDFLQRQKMQRKLDTWDLASTFYLKFFNFLQLQYHHHHSYLRSIINWWTKRFRKSCILNSLRVSYQIAITLKWLMIAYAVIIDNKLTLAYGHLLKFRILRQIERRL